MKCVFFFLSPSCRGRCAEAAPLAAEEADPWARGPLCARLAALLRRGRRAGWGGGRRRRLQRRLCDAARAARAARLQGERYLEKIETLQPWLHFKNPGSVFFLPLKLGMAPVFSAPSGEMLMLKCHYSRQPRSGQCHSQRLDLLMGSVFPVAPPLSAHLAILKGGVLFSVERSLSPNESGRRWRWGFRQGMGGQKRISKRREENESEHRLRAHPRSWLCICSFLRNHV